jgi:hypothetical protein
LVSISTQCRSGPYFHDRTQFQIGQQCALRTCVGPIITVRATLKELNDELRAHGATDGLCIQLSQNSMHWGGYQIAYRRGDLYLEVPKIERLNRLAREWGLRHTTTSSGCSSLGFLTSSMATCAFLAEYNHTLVYSDHHALQRLSCRRRLA